MFFKRNVEESIKCFLLSLCIADRIMLNIFIASKEKTCLSTKNFKHPGFIVYAM